MYFGYENYLFFVSSKVFRIKCETESALRNSSSVVSMIGNFSRILGVCLRINRSSHVSERKKEKLACFLEMNSSYEIELQQSVIALEIEQLRENRLAIEHNNTQKQENDTISTQLQIRPGHEEGIPEEHHQECKEKINLRHENEMLLYLKEKERLEMDYFIARNERSTLHLDAIVVRNHFAFFYYVYNYNYICYQYFKHLFRLILFFHSFIRSP
jgi:hypothetical protein